MPETNNFDLQILDSIIYGRVEPHIYAFTTETIPNYLKVGDTYRPIEKRLNEWRKYFPELERQFSEVAKTDDLNFYRDISVHKFLQFDLSKARLRTDTFPDITYYSNEFFENTSIQEVKEAIADINKDFVENKGKYQFYKFDGSRIPDSFTFFRIEEYPIRPNQLQTIENFKVAVASGRTNLLMYAVMRFGKSFTSMNCAVAINANLVVIVSGKADVKNEWKKTVESHKNFDGYEFLDSDDLLSSDDVVSTKLAEGKKLVVFLTLQDLQGAEIKNKHQEIFANQIDLLIIDETHFGARAGEYGKVLELNKTDLKRELKNSDESIEDVKESLKTFDAKVRLHLSGTPYRILMGGEFEKEDIIAFYQFTDIAADQQKWDEENLNKDDVKEWENPYYGFPQMIRFAFNPNESSRRRMEELKKNGATYAFSALFKPKSISKDNENHLHQKFEHESEILDLLEVIDGSKNDENLLGFLDYDKIKEGKMCRHIICVLPYRASCDALEKLILDNNEKFKNLNEYEIINIAGVENERQYRDTKDVVNKINRCEKEDKKTLTLTVNRMLTGSTVKQWDTMLYLKDTASPQEYDQAIFRLQNQYITEYKDENSDVIKFNMKPQTLLVDFDPNRMFVMQEQKALIYNVNTEYDGNNELEQRIRRELEISPIIVLNQNKMVEVSPADIMDAVRKYSNERSVLDEATIIPVDYSLLESDVIRNVIENLGEINSKQGLKINATETEGEGDEMDVPEENENRNDTNSPENSGETIDSEKEENSFKKKFATFYSLILFFAFLTNDEVKSMEDIIAAIDSEENGRIARHLGLKKEVLIILKNLINPLVLNNLDYKIQNINSLNFDTSLSPIERAGNAMKKFTRLSESEIVTPEKVTQEMINIFPEGAITPGTKMLDIASKQGEFMYAVYKKFGKEVADNFYSIPTSGVAYEFTRKVYELLELDLNHIENNYTSYDVIKEGNTIINEDQIQFNHTAMKFDAIVGNPPYQEDDGGAGASAKPIYNLFVERVKRLQPQYFSLIIPTRWFAGGKGLDGFRDEMLEDSNIAELHDFLNPKLLFRDTNNRGGICYFLWNREFNGGDDLPKIVTYNDENSTVSYRKLKHEDSDIFIRHSIAIEMLGKIKNFSDFVSFESYVSSRKPFNLEGNVIKNESIFKKTKLNNNYVKCYGKGKKIGYILKSTIVKNVDWIDRFKVFAPYANNIGTELNDDNLNTFVGKPAEICTETYIVIGASLNLDSSSALSLARYFNTKFARFLQSIAKISQHGTAKTYKFVPLQDFTSESDIDWSQSILEIDQQLYAKYGLSEEEISYIESTIKPM